MYMGVGDTPARCRRRFAYHCVVVSISAAALFEAPGLDPRASLGLWENPGAGVGVTPARRRHRAVAQRVVVSSSLCIQGTATTMAWCSFLLEAGTARGPSVV